MNPTQIPPPRVPLTDPRTGLVSREWYAYLINRDVIMGGGSVAITINELSTLVQRSGSMPGADGQDGEDGQMGIPGPQGQRGVPGQFVPGMDGQDGEDSYPMAPSGGLMYASTFEASETARVGRYTVATLPAAGRQGRIACVTDALAPAFLTIVVGSGAIVTPVFDNGTNWVAF